MFKFLHAGMSASARESIFEFIPGLLNLFLRIPDQPHDYAFPAMMCLCVGFILFYGACSYYLKYLARVRDKEDARNFVSALVLLFVMVLMYSVLQQYETAARLICEDPHLEQLFPSGEHVERRDHSRWEGLLGRFPQSTEHLVDQGSYQRFKFRNLLSILMQRKSAILNLLVLLLSLGAAHKGVDESVRMIQKAAYVALFPGNVVYRQKSNVVYNR